MQGQPVWLASVSLREAPRNNAKIIGTSKWDAIHFAAAKHLAYKVLDGVGDRRRERAFRMNITFCVHRALSQEEIDHLDPSFQHAPGGLAGGPVEVLWSKGIAHCTASMPCENPGKDSICGDQPELWVPIDCGDCPPCQARKKIEESIVHPLRERHHETPIETPAVSLTDQLRGRMRRRRPKPKGKRSR